MPLGRSLAATLTVCTGFPDQPDGGETTTRRRVNARASRYIDETGEFLHNPLAAG